ncbi:hypothetical protein L7F22_014919 [Adiantum nelumboides]|nr:hypothetical protein [Adiantum nelumboides]
MQRGPSEDPSASHLVMRLALELANKSYDLPTTSNAIRIIIQIADGCSAGSRWNFTQSKALKTQRRPFEHPSANRLVMRLALELANNSYDLPASSNASHITIRIVDECLKDRRCNFTQCKALKRNADLSSIHRQPVWYNYNIAGRVAATMALYHQTPTNRVPIAEGEIVRYSFDRYGGVVRRLGRGVQAVWQSISINSPRTLGTASGTYHEITFIEDERITSLTLLATLGSKNRRSAGLRLTTSRGRLFEPRIATQNSLGALAIDVLSGVEQLELLHHHRVVILVGNGRHECVYASVSVGGRIPFVGSLGAEAGWELSQSATLENGQEAWEKYKDEKVLDLVDERLGVAFSPKEAIRVVHVALLCTQENAKQRPTMSLITLWLFGSSGILEYPSSQHFLITMTE